MKIKQLLFFPFIFLGIQLHAQIIPSSRTVDWSHVGYEGTIPYSATVVDVTTFGAIGDSVTDNYQFIVNAINSLNGNRGIIQFPSGNFLIQSTLTIPDSVILRGVSSDSTHLIFDFAGVVGNAINVIGSTPYTFTNVLAGYSKGSSYIIVADTAGYIVGDYAEIQEDNGLWDSRPASWADHSIGQIIRINFISGDTLFFTQPLRITYDSALNVQVRKFIPAREIGIECMHIYRRDNVTTGLCINIYFNHAVNCWVRGVESSKSVGSHIEADQSAHLEITGNYIHHSFLYDGVSTHGYGITLFKHTCECKVENNTMKHLRHSFSMQCGSNGNVIGYNYSIDPNRSEFPYNAGADISMHGHYCFANLIEGNIVQNIQIDSTWGPTGPYNTFFRNRAELYGILMSAGVVTSDSENFVGNETTYALLGFYAPAGNGHFEYGNNIRGVITPAGATTIGDSSYYISSVPSFWNTASAFPSVGLPNALGSGSIPAQDRYLSGVNFTTCSETIILSLPNQSTAGQIKIFPNPASSFITVSIQLAEEKISKLILTDVLGRVQIEKRFYPEANTKAIQFDIPETLKAGIYSLSVITDKRIITKKIVLN